MRWFGLLSSRMHPQIQFGDEGKTGPTSMSKSRREDLSKRAGDINIPVLEVHIPITGRSVK